MSEYKTLKYAPIGEWIEICHGWLEPPDWCKAQVLYKGNNAALVAVGDKEECAIGLETQWRHPVDPIEELEKKILELWCSQDVAYAWDAWKDIPHRWILQTLVDAGADIDAI